MVRTPKRHHHLIHNAEETPLVFVPTPIVVVSFTLFVYDYILTLPDELDLVWTRSKRSQGLRLAGVLFLLNRYPAFIDLTLSLYKEIAFSITARQFRVMDEVVGAMFLFGGCVSEILMILRVWALWGKTRAITLFLTAMATAVLIAGIAIYSKSRDTLIFLPLDVINLPGCYPDGENALKVLDYCTLLTMEFVIMFLTIYQCIKRSRLGISAFFHPITLIELFVRDGSLYFVCLLAVAVVNVYMTLVDGDAGIDRVISLQRCLHSVLVSRIYLSLKKGAQDELQHSFANVEPIVIDVSITKISV